MSPVIEIANVTKAADHPTPDYKEDNSAAPILADAPSSCPSSESKTAVGNLDTVTLALSNTGSHASDVHAASLTSMFFFFAGQLD